MSIKVSPQPETYPEYNPSTPDTGAANTALMYAMLSVVFILLGLVIAFFLLAAVVCGVVAVVKAHKDRSPYPPRGASPKKDLAALILGYVFTIVSATMIVLSAVALADLVSQLS